LGLKIPNGLRIGALLGAALLSIMFHRAYMPPPAKFVVQVIAGAFIHWVSPLTWEPMCLH
jgi:uncharacterized membrane protein AbrB (regulator of aidB expression)